MHATFRKLREERADRARGFGFPRIRHRQRLADDAGFTLIEMLVVVVIIGVLAAIAIPVYLNYREGALNKSAMADVRGGIATVEQYYTDNGNYPSDLNGTANNNLEWDAGETVIVVSDGNTLNFNADGASYVICGRNTDGEKIYIYNSATGDPVHESTQATLALCTSTGT